jgi:hypothetical protein
VSSFLELDALCRERAWVLGVALERVGASDVYEFRLKVYDGRPTRRARLLANESAGTAGDELDAAAAVALSEIRLAESA